MSDDEKISKMINKIMLILNKKGLTIPELLMFYGNLGYHIGASIANCTNTGPGLEELKKEYYSNPTIDTYLMLQGLMITGMEEDFVKQPKLSRFYNKE